ncbi:MAG: TIGR03111 family XrtG-associated glycosyltransferase [Lachnospira sp.]
MAIINSFLNSVLFWAAWIIIPLMMEIVPSIGSIIILIKKKLSSKEKYTPALFPEITVIIPIYNSQDTLRACIKSINDSDYPNKSIRILLVNNQGQDDSFDIYCKSQEEFPDLKMQWLNAKQGKSKALNMALFNSNGKYIIHIDSDGVLEKSALMNMVCKFESDSTIECMTGAILTEPKLVQQYPLFFPRMLRKIEFMEYAQAFLAGRNYASETNSIYTLSGAFSAFRKSAVLKSQMYNTDTICEDTHITFQMKYLLNIKVSICEDAIFFVDPIENLNKLYTQRQRWQRGSLEVSSMFLKKKMNPLKMFTNVNLRTLVYDHTFAFPRIIWYLILICLMFMNYSMKQIVVSTLVLYLLYIIIGILYYISTIGFLSEFKDIRKYYIKQWYVIPFMPFFNLLVFFIRFAGIINSINTNSAWKTRNFTEECNSFSSRVSKDMNFISRVMKKVRAYVNEEAS